MPTTTLQNGSISDPGNQAPLKVPIGLQAVAQHDNAGIEIDTSDNSQTTKPELFDSFWDYAQLDGTRWNQLYPYRLAIWHKEGSKWVFNSSELTPFVLPVSPEALTISTPFAITTSVTLGGIVEEHNGAPLRMITIQATTGVNPLRGTATSPQFQSIGVSSIVGGIVGPIVNPNINFRTASSQTTPTVTPPNVINDFSGDIGKSTGYYQFFLLQKFLEAYVALKKTTKGRNYILALEMWKDQEVYLVSPVAFERHRGMDKPLEYTYTIQLKAWRRVRIANNGATLVSIYKPPAQDHNRLLQFISALQTVQSALEDARPLISGLISGVQNVLFTPIREVLLAAKGIVGIGISLIDLPSSIITEVAENILETKSIGKSLAGAASSVPGAISAEAQAISDAFSALSISSSKAETGAARTASTSSALTGASPANKIAQDPNSYYTYFKNIDPASLSIRPSTQKKIDDEKTRVRQFKREDYETRRDSIQSVINTVQNAVGAGNATYTRIYGLPTTTTTHVTTDFDYDILHNLNQALIEMNRLVVSSSINQDEISTLDYFAGLATQSGIAFTVPTSKFLVPFPYGHTLEQLSSLYLSTPDRWHEIAALNGLQAPYVDEIGFQLPLLTNGSGNSVTVSDASSLYINQPVWIGSSTVTRTNRHITKITQLGPGLWSVAVDGDANLDQYLLSSSAYLQAFLPNTVNSQQSIFIPSPDVADDTDFRQKSIPGIDYFDPLVRVGGIDLLLTPTGDIVITSDGDSRLAVGLTNIVQKVRLALGTVRGSLLHHKDYGFPIQIGQSVADLTAQDLLRMVKDLFRDDPTFSGVESAAILKAGPVLQINLSVGIAGTQKVIPISVSIPR